MAFKFDLENNFFLKQIHEPVRQLEDEHDL